MSRNQWNNTAKSKLIVKTPASRHSTYEQMQTFFSFLLGSNIPRKFPFLNPFSYYLCDLKMLGGTAYSSGSALSFPTLFLGIPASSKVWTLNTEEKYILFLYTVVYLDLMVWWLIHKTVKTINLIYICTF